MMKLNKGILTVFVLFLILFICLGSAYAQEAPQESGGNSTEKTGVGESNPSTPLNAGQGTYTNLRSEIGEGKNVTLSLSNYRWVNSDGEETIVIKNPCVIDGNGARIDMYDLGLNGRSMRIFNVECDGVTFKNITFMYGKYNPTGNAGGAAVYFRGGGTVINCTFHENEVNGGNGGALYFSKKGSVINSTFELNNVMDLNRGYGGAVYFNENGEVTGCSFISNYAERGGALYFRGTGNVSDCSFKKNKVERGAGGAVCFQNEGSVINCNFTENKANRNGGAIYFDGTGNVSDCNFMDNRALLGGAIYFFRNGNVVDNSTFRNCIANGIYEGEIGGAGGSVYVSGNSSSISGSTFENSQSVNYGGAIHVDGNNVKITKNSFENCSTIRYNGGAVFVKGLNAEISDSNFTKNRVNTSNFACGGSIAVEANTAMILGCIFKESIAYDGGAVYVNGLNGRIVNSAFSNISALNSGGAVYMNGYSAAVFRSTFDFINATNFGGAVYLSGSGVRIDGDVFENCSCDMFNGGAVYINGSFAKVYASNFIRTGVNESNFACGGAVYVNGSNTEIVRSNFDYCVAYEGGAVYVNGLDAHIGDSSFSNASAFNGGAVYVDGAKANVYRSTFDFINASNEGGAVYVNGSDAAFSESFFTDCSSVNGGGAIYVNGSDAYVFESNFTRTGVNVSNFACGGAIYLNGNGAEVSASSFDYCVAYGGGAVYVNGFGPRVDSSSFTDCSSVNGGGAIYVNGSDAYVLDSNFTRNGVNVSNFACGGAIYVNGNNTEILRSNFDCCVAYDGGIVYVYGNDTHIDYSSFANASAFNGGAVYVDGSRVNVYRSTFDFIDASNVGGAVYVNGLDAAFSESSFADCSSVNGGGAIYVNGYGAYVFKSNFTRNGVNVSNFACGGAIYVNGNYTNVLESNFEFGTAYEGAFIYLSGTNAIIYDSTFSNSSALNSGGAVYVDGDNATVSQSTFNSINAVNYGGALYLNGAGVRIDADAFENCSCDMFNGGAVYIRGLNALVSDSTFTGNRVNMSNYANGGAVYIEGGDARIRGCEFMNASASRGGALFVEGNGTAVSDSLFSYCRVDIGGGAIYFNGAGNVSGCNFTDNLAGAYEGGGAIYFMGEGSVVGSDFTRNKAIVGAAIFARSNFKNPIVNSTFLRNNAQSLVLALSEENNIVTISFMGSNNYLNAIYAVEDLDFVNVTYWGVDGVMNTDDGGFYKSTYESGQNISVTINNTGVIEEIVKTTDVYGNALVDFSSVCGNIKLTAVHKDDDYYTESNVETISFKTIFNTSINLVGYGFTVQANVYPNITSNVTFTVRDKNNSTVKVETVNLTGSTACIDLFGLPAGEYNITARCNGNEWYLPSEATLVYETKKINPVLTVDAPAITVGENATVKVTLPVDATGSVLVGDENVTLEGGSAIAVISGLPVGVTTLPVVYSGDAVYNSVVSGVSITVRENTTLIVTAPDVVKYYKGPEKFIVTVTDYKGKAVAGKSVNISLNGADYFRTTNSEGVASLSINLNSGEYAVGVAVDDVKVDSTIIVKPTIDASDVVKVFRNATQYYATFLDVNGTPTPNVKVSFNINGVIYNRTTDANGDAKLNINLDAGEYILTAINTETGEMKSNVIKVISLIEADDLTKYYKNDSQFVVRIHTSDGGYVGAGEEVTFNINGILYTRTTNATGHAKLNINLGAGDYIITTYYGDCGRGNNIEVLPVLSAGDLVMKYLDGSQFKAELVDGEGNPYPEQSVRFNINGVFYDRGTDASGVAKLNIRLMPGVYIITSSFNGCNIANNITVTA